MYQIRHVSAACLAPCSHWNYLLETLLETFPIPHTYILLLSIGFFKYIFHPFSNFGDLQKKISIFLCIFTIFLSVILVKYCLICRIFANIFQKLSLCFHIPVILLANLPGLHYSNYE